MTSPRLTLPFVICAVNLHPIRMLSKLRLARPSASWWSALAAGEVLTEGMFLFPLQLELGVEALLLLKSDIETKNFKQVWGLTYWLDSVEEEVLELDLGLDEAAEDDDEEAAADVLDDVGESLRLLLLYRWCWRLKLLLLIIAPDSDLKHSLSCPRLSVQLERDHGHTVWRLWASDPGFQRDGQVGNHLVCVSSEHQKMAEIHEHAYFSVKLPRSHNVYGQAYIQKAPEYLSILPYKNQNSNDLLLWQLRRAVAQLLYTLHKNRRVARKFKPSNLIFKF